MFKQVSVFLPNNPGVLANFIELLIDKKIFIRAMTVAETEDYGLLLLLVDKLKKLIKLLEENDYIFSTTDVIAVKLVDNIGGLYKISKLFGEKKLNIEYLYSTLIEGEALVVLKMDDNEKAIELLKNNEFKLAE